MLSLIATIVLLPQGVDFARDVIRPKKDVHLTLPSFLTGNLNSSF